MRGLWTKPRAISSRRRIPPLEQIDCFQQIVDIALALLFGNLIELGIDGEIFFDGEIDVAGKRLGNDADGSPDRIGFAGDVMAGDDCLPAGDGQQRGHHADECALAGAIWPQQAEDLPFGNLEVDAGDGFEITVTLDNVVDNNRRLGLAGTHCATSLSFGI